MVVFLAILLQVVDGLKRDDPRVDGIMPETMSWTVIRHLTSAAVCELGQGHALW